MTGIDLAHLKTWIGRTETADDVLTTRIAAEFGVSVLDSSRPVASGDPAAIGIHWCLAPPLAPMSQLGPDGHPARGGFVPPVPLPRRMWAGGRLAYSGDIRVGDMVTRRSQIENVEMKQGATGPLVFVLVSHVYETPRGPAIREEHDIVYRGETPLGEPSAKRAPKEKKTADTRRMITPSPVLLFRYSAMTFNGHRIHYDRTYARETEHYPGLIVHGPLQATFLLNLAREIAGSVKSFSFRAVKPLFDLAPFSICARETGGAMELWAEDAEGDPTMTAKAER